MLGRPLQPWQRDVAALTGERDPYTGRLVYQRVILLAPRRSGKSLLMLARGLATCTRPRARAFYASAHATNAARMWRDDWFVVLGDFDPYQRHLRLTRGNGQEAVRFTPRNGGGTFRLVAATGAAIRGAATNLVVIDEAQELGPDAGDELEAAAFPTLATGAGGQAWIVGTAGGEWFARWRDIGRAAVAADRRAGVCLIEYAAPDDADPDDETTWLAAHPGLASGNVHLEAVRADHDVMTPDAFAAEYLGRWPGTLVDDALVEAWAEAAGRWPTPTLGDPVVFALEVDEDRERAVIVAAGDHPAGVALELVDARPLGPWVGPRLVELAERHNPVAVAYDAAGPAGSLRHELAEVPTRIVAFGTRDVTAGAGWFHDTVMAGHVAHRADVELDAAVAAARRRRAGGAWLWDRRQPGALPWLAATLAGWAHRDGRHRRPGAA